MISVMSASRYKMLPSILRITWLKYLQSLKSLRPTVYEDMHLQENILFDLDLWTKVTQNGVQYPLRPMSYGAVSS